MLFTAMILGWSGVFNLSSKIWMWWSIESFVYFPIGCAVMGWVGQKISPV